MDDRGKKNDDKDDKDDVKRKQMWVCAQKKGA